MKVFFIVLAFVFLALSIVIGINKSYCYVFKHKDWKLWKAVLNKFKDSKHIEHYYKKTYPGLENYKFRVTLDDGTNYVLIYWVHNHTCAVFNESGRDIVLCGFDKYHSNMAVKMAEEKLNENENGQG